LRAFGRAPARAVATSFTIVAHQGGARREIRRTASRARAYIRVPRFGILARSPRPPRSGVRTWVWFRLRSARSPARWRTVRARWPVHSSPPSREGGPRGPRLRHL